MEMGKGSVRWVRNSEYFRFNLALVFEVNGKTSSDSKSFKMPKILQSKES